jgi:hypothetical protein
MAEPAEQRRQEQHAEEPAHQKRILKIRRQQALLRARGDPRVKRGHARALSTTVTRSAMRRT